MGRSRQSSLGELIRRQRELHELSMRELARLSGISNPYLSQIERGLRAPSERVVESIARSLQTSADALYEQAGLDRDAEEEEPEVERALREDRGLTARQRQSLLGIYRAFLAENDSRRRPRG
jgi:transcriptional regulator with XRE-family HTH domain